MFITDVIRLLRIVHEHHGDLEVVDDRLKPVIGVTLERGDMFNALLLDGPVCLISTIRDK